jgi:hypothetical protein
MEVNEMTILILLILGIVLHIAVFSLIDSSNSEEIFDGIFLIFQVAFLVLMFFLFKDGEVIRRKVFGHSEYEAFFVAWLFIQAVSVILSMDSFFRKKFSDSVGIGVFFLIFFFFFLFLFYFWPFLAFVITFAILGIVALIVLGPLASSSGGGGGAGVVDKSERDDEEENTRIHEIYYEGLKEGRKNNHKKKDTLGIMIDGVLNDGSAPLFKYNQEEKDAWEKGYKRGKWED